MTIYERFDVVVVPFPFVDSPTTKPRPALVLSTRAFNAAHDASLLAMITTAAHTHWASDVTIDHAAAGLRVFSVVRLKLFTLGNDMIARRIGALAPADRPRVRATLADCLGV